MDKVYVLIKLDAEGDFFVKAYADKDVAAAYAMEQVYGEDWELQMEDPEWEKSNDIQLNYESLLEDYGFTDDDGNVWSINETEIIK